MEKYSVLMSVYYKEKPEYLELAIESMLNQTVLPDEILIVKDGDITNELQNILDKYKQKHENRFTIVGYKETKGLAYALNYGLNRCRNNLVARMDSDDYSLPLRCELQLKVIEKNPEISLVGTGIGFFEKTPKEPLDKFKYYPDNIEDMKQMIRRNSAFAHVSVMYKRDVVLSIGGYDSKLRLGQDQDLFSKMIYKGVQAFNINKELVLVRSDQSLKLRRKNKESCRSRIIVQKRLLKRKQCNIIDFLIIYSSVLIVRIMPEKVFLKVYSLLKENKKK